jgi:hypothetical protein
VPQPGTAGDPVPEPAPEREGEGSAAPPVGEAVAPPTYPVPANPAPCAVRIKPKSALIIGSGPVVIGQAAEFDYAGTQACRALRA